MPLSINVIPASSANRDAWNNYVETKTDASPYHLFGWGEAVERAYGFSPCYYLAEQKGRVIGILPLIKINRPFSKDCEMNGLPYCDLGMPLADDPVTFRLLVDQAMRTGQEHRARCIELRGSPSYPIGEYVQQPIKIIQDKVRMVLDLPSSSSALWEGFKSKLRSQVRKAKKNNLDFRFTESHEEFYTIFCRNMHRLGSPVHAANWFESIIGSYRENVKIGMVYHGDKAIAGGIILRAGGCVCIPWASTLREYNRLSPNMLLYWNFLKYAADNNLVRFDFGRSSPGAGTYRFKAQWGARPEPLIWNRIFLTGPKHMPKKILPGKRRILAGLWQKIPLGCANKLGPLLRKYITL